MPLSLNDLSLNDLGALIHDYLLIEHQFPKKALDILDLKEGICQSFVLGVLFANFLKTQPPTSQEQQNPGINFRDDEKYQKACQQLLVRWHNDKKSVTPAEKNQISDYVEHILSMSPEQSTFGQLARNIFPLEYVREGTIGYFIPGQTAYLALNNITEYSASLNKLTKLKSPDRLAAIVKALTDLPESSYFLAFLTHAAGLIKSKNVYTYIESNFTPHPQTRPDRFPILQHHDPKEIAGLLLLSAHMTKNEQVAIVEFVPSIWPKPIVGPSITAFDPLGYTNLLKLAALIQDSVAVEEILQHSIDANQFLVDKEKILFLLLWPPKDIWDILLTDKQLNLDINFYFTNSDISVLMHAADNNAIDFIESVVQNALANKIVVKPNMVSGKNETALWRAAEAGHTDIINLLLQLPGIDVNLANQNGISPLSIAIHKNHISAAKALAADPRISASEINTSLTLALIKGKNALLADLLTHPAADVNSGNPPLLYQAASKNQIEALKLLLQHSPKPNLNIQFSGETPLAVAAANGNPEAVALLMKAGAGTTLDINFINAQGNTPLFLAVKNKHLAVAKELLLDSHTNLEVLCNEDTALSLAVKQQDLAMINLLITAGANALAMNHKKATPLSHAIGPPENSAIIQLLLQAQINLMDKTTTIPTLKLLFLSLEHSPHLREWKKTVADFTAQRIAYDPELTTTDKIAWLKNIEAQNLFKSSEPFYMMFSKNAAEKVLEQTINALTQQLEQETSPPISKKPAK